jgi:PAS domain S-box-containing protein
MFRKELRESVRYKFLRDISAILLISTFVLTTVIALNERRMLKHSLTTKGQSFVSYIANLSQDPLIMKNYIQLDLFVNEANKDEDILYIIIQDAHGNILTSQYASINYQSQILKGVLSGLSKESEFPDILSAIKKNEDVLELSIPIVTGSDTIGEVALGMSQYNIRKQILKTMLFVIALNLAVMFVLGSVLFIASRKTILDPIIELSHAADRLAKGDLSTHVNIQATGEVRMLVDSFNKMARDLEKTTVSKEYVDNIIKSMIDTLIVASPDGVIRTVNQAACELLGYREEELTGQPIKIIFAEDGDRAFEELIKFRLMKNAEYTYVTKDSRKIPVLVSSSVIYTGDATARGIVCVAVDITERKRAEAALEQINEEMKNFAYIVSHDLRAPLVNIKGFSDELNRSIKEFTPLLEKYQGPVDAGEKQRTEEILKKDIPEALGFIGSSVTRMDELISSILKLSRLGRNEIKPELLRTEDVVHALLKSLAHQIDMHHAELTTGPLPDIVMDRTAAEQIFSNLLDNALKYLEPSRPGKIEVTAEQNAGETTFTIRDNGRGIAKEDTQKVFELFRRVGRQDVPGEGMGLTYVNTLVRRLGGRIWCESEPGVGTAFSFTIPRTLDSKERVS